MKEDECNNVPKFVAIYFIDPKDIVWDQYGKWRLKRKYGKRKRTVYKVDLTKTLTP